jgi:hypothetical protein
MVFRVGLRCYHLVGKNVTTFCTPCLEGNRGAIFRVIPLLISDFIFKFLTRVNLIGPCEPEGSLLPVFKRVRCPFKNKKDAGHVTAGACG